MRGSLRVAPLGAVAGELLWTRADELPDPQAITGLLGILVESGQLDRAKATAWGFVRSIDYWLWGLENGLTIDPLRCQRVANALAPLAELSVTVIVSRHTGVPGHDSCH